MNRISLLGCGWLGLPLAESLIAEGYVVKGSTRSESKLKSLKNAGIQAHQIDIEAIDKQIEDFLACEVLIINITSKSPENYQKLIELIVENRVPKVLFVSSTSVYPNTNGEVTEEQATLDTPLSTIEKLFLAEQSFKTTLLRFGGLFGYDRKPGNFFKPGRVIDHPEGYVNMIHRDDCIAIMKQIIKQGTWGEVFNACADTHPTRRDYYTQEALKVGKEPPEFNENSKNEFKIIESNRLKKQLNYSFKHSDLMDL